MLRVQLQGPQWFGGFQRPLCTFTTLTPPSPPPPQSLPRRRRQVGVHRDETGSDGGDFGLSWTKHHLDVNDGRGVVRAAVLRRRLYTDVAAQFSPGAHDLHRAPAARIHVRPHTHTVAPIHPRRASTWTQTASSWSLPLYLTPSTSWTIMKSSLGTTSTAAR